VCIHCLQFLEVKEELLTINLLVSKAFSHVTRCYDLAEAEKGVLRVFLLATYLVKFVPTVLVVRRVVKTLFCVTNVPVELINDASTHISVDVGRKP